MRVTQIGDMVGNRSKGSSIPAKKADQIRAEQQERDDNQQVVERCVFCPNWSFTGTAGEGRAAAAKHRASKHPNLKPARALWRNPQSPRIPTVNAPRTAEEQDAALREAEWRRLRATGAVA